MIGMMTLKQISSSCVAFGREYSIRSFSLPFCFWATTKFDALFETEGQGMLALSDIDHKCQKAEVMLAFDGEGECKGALSEILAYCFGKLNLNKVCVKATWDNALCKILEEMGFVQEVTLRDHCLEKDVYKNVNWYSIFASNKGAQ